MRPPWGRPRDDGDDLGTEDAPRRSVGVVVTHFEQPAELANACEATLIGPGLVETETIQRLLPRLLPILRETVLVLDSEAMMAASARSMKRRAFSSVISASSSRGGRSPSGQT